MAKQKKKELEGPCYKSCPERIQLCISDDETHYDEPVTNMEDVTWASDSPVACTVEYVRLDVVGKLCLKNRAEGQQAGYVEGLSEGAYRRDV